MKIGFVSERIGPPEHRVVRLRRQRLEGRLREQRPDHVHEVVRIGGDSQDRDPERIVEVLVDRASHGCARQTSRDRPDVAATAKRQQLHEQAVVGALRHAVLEGAAFAEVRRLEAGAALRDVGPTGVGAGCWIDHGRRSGPVSRRIGSHDVGGAWCERVWNPAASSSRRTSAKSGDAPAGTGSPPRVSSRSTLNMRKRMPSM